MRIVEEKLGVFRESRFFCTIAIFEGTIKLVGNRTNVSDRRHTRAGFDFEDKPPYPEEGMAELPPFLHWGRIHPERGKVRCP